MSDPDLDPERLARRYTEALLAYCRRADAATALAYHETKSALLAAVSRLPGGRWWRGETCYQAGASGLVVWSEPGRGEAPRPRVRPRPNSVRFYTGPGVVPRVGEPLYPPRRRVPA